MTAHETNEIMWLAPMGPMWEGSPCDELERTLGDLARAGRRVVVDLSQAGTLTAHCLGVLAHAHELARANGGEIALCGADRVQRWLLSKTHLTEAIVVYRDRESAVAALAAPRQVA